MGQLDITCTAPPPLAQRAALPALDDAAVQWCKLILKANFETRRSHEFYYLTQTHTFRLQGLKPGAFHAIDKLHSTCTVPTANDVVDAHPRFRLVHRRGVETQVENL
jgi:hypothetical protein